MKLAPSVQRRILELTPARWLDSWCRSRPKFVIELLCHWINEKNIDIEERGLAPIKSASLVAVVKKFSKVSAVSILYLLKQDESLWKLYMAGVGTISFKTLPYIMLELMYDLGGSEGRAKVVDVVLRSRQTIGGRIQGDLLENFKTDTVIDIFETLPEFDVRMRLMFNKPETVAFWLDHWDLRMKRIGQPLKSEFWLAKLPGERAFQIQTLMTKLEFRKRPDFIEHVYEYENDWKEVKDSLKE
jgi:hypothetical protein